MKRPGCRARTTVRSRGISFLLWPTRTSSLPDLCLLGIKLTSTFIIINGGDSLDKHNEFPEKILSPFHVLAVAFIATALLVCTPPTQARPKNKVENRPYADQKRWHLGFSVGMGLQDLKFTHNGFTTPEGQQWAVDVPQWSPAINVTVLGDLRLHKYLNLRFSPGMSFGSKNVTMREHFSGETLRQDVKSVYVLLPLDLKISGDRWHNSRPYVTIGAMGCFDVGKTL